MMQCVPKMKTNLLSLGIQKSWNGNKKQVKHGLKLQSIYFVKHHIHIFLLLFQNHYRKLALLCLNLRSF